MIGEEVSGQRGQARGGRDGCALQKVPAGADSVHMDAVRLVPHRELWSP